MTKLTIILLVFFNAFSLSGQPEYQKPYGKRFLIADYQFFKQIRQLTNSGLYKYRSTSEIDSIFKWGLNQINDSTSLIDFYKILTEITDFEGSCHNDTQLPRNVKESIKKEVSMFPLPVKIIEGKLLVNTSHGLIPLGSQITSINGYPATTIIQRLGRYYTTDGFSVKAKTFQLYSRFSLHFRYEFGPQKEFVVGYTEPNSNRTIQTKILSVSYTDYEYVNKMRHSLKFDSLVNYYEGMAKYSFALINPSIAYLRLRIFTIGDNAKDPEHKKYRKFLDSCFTFLRQHKEVNNLIIDPRGNPGGSDPNDQITFSYLASRPFQENKSAYVVFHKIPEWKHVAYRAFFLKRWIAKGVYQRQLRKQFPIEKDRRFFSGINEDNTPRLPSPLAFSGQMYLLINPSIGSAGSMFSAMVRGNTNTLPIGEETEGGYYGHNGHQPMGYDLPHTKIRTVYSIVNLEQDVPVLEKQPFGRGIIPEHFVEQTFDDFMNNKDTQMDFLLNLIASKK